jgi:hypothetical protein
MLQFAKMSSSGALTFKEFILCLCLGSVLQLFPLMRAFSVDETAASTSVASAAPGPATDTGAGTSTVASSGPATSQSTAATPPAATQPLENTELRGSSLYAPGQVCIQLLTVYTHKVIQLLVLVQRLVMALRIVLEAYVLFDADASGTIDRDEVLSMIDEQAGKSSAGKKGRREGNGLLSKDRWMELDWDGDGQVGAASYSDI